MNGPLRKECTPHCKSFTHIGHTLVRRKGWSDASDHWFVDLMRSGEDLGKDLTKKINSSSSSRAGKGAPFIACVMAKLIRNPR